MHEHDLGLAHDVHMMERMLISRRRALSLIASAGGIGLVSACGNAGGTTTSSTASTSGDSTAACIGNVRETDGPFPGDGTNNSGGVTSNVLPVSGVVRSDIRPSFIGSTPVATGVELTLTLTVVNVNAACAPLVGYALYLWHCDRLGQYSLYDLPAQSYLRGLQVTNANGQVTFTTIFPGSYAGRFPHMHVEVFSSLSNATSGSSSVLTSQLVMPSAACTAVYADQTIYGNSGSRFAAVPIANDNIFSDNTAAQIAAMTPALTGSPAAGYSGTVTIGIDI